MRSVENEEQAKEIAAQAAFTDVFDGFVGPHRTAGPGELNAHELAYIQRAKPDMVLEFETETLCIL